MIVSPGKILAAAAVCGVAVLFSLALSGCGGGFGGAEGSPILDANPSPEKIAVAAGDDISAEEGRKVAETVSRLNLGLGGDAVSPEDVRVSHDRAVLDRDPFSASSGVPAARELGVATTRALRGRGYKAFEFPVPAESPIMTVAVWISETPPPDQKSPDPKTPGGKTDAPAKTIYVRLQVFVSPAKLGLAGSDAMVQELETEEVAVQVKTPKPKPETPSVVASVAASVSTPTCAAGEVLDSRGNACVSVSPPLVAVNFSALGMGTLSAQSGGGFLSSGDEVPQGSRVTFTAVPAAGHYVSGWGGECAGSDLADRLDGSAECWLAADADLAVEAEFSAAPSLAGPLCPAGTLPANGMTQAELDAGLIAAAKANDLAGACEYLRRGADVDARGANPRFWDAELKVWTYSHWTGLMIAADGGYLELAHLLVANGADVDEHSDFSGRSAVLQLYYGGWTALHYGLNRGHRDLIRYLLDSGADVHAEWRDGASVLWTAAGWAYPDLVELLLSHGADANSRFAPDSPLVFAPDLSAFHVAAYAVLDPRPWTNPLGPTPTFDMMATVLSLLAAGGADVNSRDLYGSSALDNAAALGNAEVAALLRGLGVQCFVETGPLCGDVLVAVNFSASGSGALSAHNGGDSLSSGDEVRQGATVVFTAVPLPGHYVSGWGGACAGSDLADRLDGSAECWLAADADLAVEAEFSAAPSLAGPLCPAGTLPANGLTQAEVDEQLHTAATGRDLAETCEWLRRGANVNANHGESPLHAAIASFYPAKMAKILLVNGADVNARDHIGESPLHWAMLNRTQGRFRVHDAVSVLIAHGADVNLSSNDGETPLHLAAAFLKSHRVKLMLDNGAEINRRDGKGYSPLDHAVDPEVGSASHHRKPSVARVLREHGGRCFVQSGPLCGGEDYVAVYFSASGPGTLFVSAAIGELSSGDEVRQGASVLFEATPASGYYVSGWGGACAGSEVADGLDGTVKVCELAADSDLTAEASFSAVPSLSGPACPAGTLPANGMTQDALDAGLILAARGNDLAGACEYLRRGANVDAWENFVPVYKRGAIERTPLAIAAMEGWLELARLLLNNGGEVNWQSGRRLSGGAYGATAGWSALHHAAGAGHLEVSRLLLDRGAEIDLRWDDESTALHEAARFVRWRVVNLLLSRGAEANVLNVSGGTPLHMAATHGNLPDPILFWPLSFDDSSWEKTTEALLAAGADVNAVGVEHGESPLDRIARYRRLALANWHPILGSSRRDLRSTGPRAAKLRAADGKCFRETGPLCGDVPVAYSASGLGTLWAESGGGPLSSGDEVRQGATVVFTAVPAAGHYVSGWGGACAGSEVADGLDGTAKECELAADAALAVEAEFSPIPSLATADCPAGSLPANGLTQAELNLTLRAAARGGDSARVCEALRRGAEVNDDQGGTEFTPLQEAVHGGHLRAAELLLANGAEVNARKEGLGPSPLDLAAKGEKEKIARALRDAGGRCFLETGPLCGGAPVAGPGAATILVTVANTVVVETLSCPAGSLPANGLTQEELNQDLIWEIKFDNAHGVCKFLRRGANANFNSAPHGGGTPLHFAVFYMSFSSLLQRNWDSEAAIALLLIAAGADVNAVNDDGETPLYTVAESGGGDGLLAAAEMLLMNGANLNAQDKNGVTPLHLAALLNKPEIARLLLEHGANPNLANNEGETPLDWARNEGYSEIVVMMAAANPPAVVATVGVTVVAETLSCPAGTLPANGMTQEELDGGLLGASLDKPAEEICEWLRRGANVNGEGTPLVAASYFNEPAVLRVLLENGADVNLASSYKKVTPLHFAVSSNKVAKVRLLLEYGADVNLADIDGETPLDWARNREKFGVTRLAIVAMLEAAAGAPAVASRSVPVSEDRLALELRGRFGDAFNAGPAFGDSFGAVAGSSGGLLSRLDGVMRGGVSAKESWASFSGWQQENTTGRLWFSTRHRGDFGFGAGGGGMGGAVDGSPFAAISGNGLLAGGEMALGSGGSERLRFAAFGDLQSRSLLSGEERRWTDWAASGTAIETAMAEAERLSGVSDNRTRGALTEIHLGDSVGGSGLAFQAGALSESESLLAGTSRGEDLRGLRSRTAFAGVSGSADLFGGGGWRVRGAAHVGRSWAESSGVLRSGDLWASSFSAGLERGGWLYSGDGVMLRISQPLRVESWEMDLMEGGEVRRLLVSPSGRQLDLDAAYRLPLSGGGWLLLSAGVRRGSGHVGSSGLEGGALFSLERDF